ncbi:MAG: hypothetical protein GF349_03130 [Candidatus Magasanikbacteria bacterium]|nr:hypothetical protein [Candidatus Magasanikbacteria bacterium]
MFSGIVIRGDEIGKKIGYPTANLDTPKRKIDLESGVYAVWVGLRRKKYQGALAIQSSPWKVEVHLIDYKGGDFYGTYIEVEPIQKVSEMCRYNSQYELKEKIERDLEMIRGIFE